jgi:hypothetical protein
MAQYKTLSPVFICGHHRSGTSLLAHLLDGHPELIVNGVESKFYAQFVPHAEGLDDIEKRIELAHETLLRNWKTKNEFYEIYFSSVEPSDVLKRFKTELLNSPKELKDYLESAVFSYGVATNQLNENNKYWVEKTPHHEYFIEHILKSWSSPKFIHMFRDPRDLHSTLRRRHGDVFSVRTTILNWKRSVDQMEKNLSKIGSSNCLSIKYEDFVNDPEVWLEKIRLFLDIPDKESLRKPTICGGSVDWKGNTVNKQYSGISNKSVGQWKKQFAIGNTEIKILEYLLRKEMIKYGYERRTKIDFINLVKANHYKLVMRIKLIRQALRKHKKPVL